MKHQSVIFKAKRDYKSVNNYLKSIGFSDKLISFYKKNNNLIKLNGVENNTLEPVLKKSKVEIFLPNESNNIPLIDKPLNIVYEDNFYLIINKPSNLASSPTQRHIENNVSGMIANYFKEQKISSKVHLVNRLDKENSGLMIIAKHQIFHSLMVKSNITKKYRLLVEGFVKPESGTIEKKIGKLGDLQKRVELVDGDNSITKYQVKKYFSDKSLVEAELVTGRTHQIRLHFSLIGHPIVGDSLYGNKGEYLFLQSYYLKFKHPIYNKVMSFKLSKPW